MSNKKDENICGVTQKILYDKKVKKLNLELAIDKIGSPVIIFEDWTNPKKIKELFRLHLHEAIDLKSVIDTLSNDFLWNKIEKLEGKMQ